MLAKKQGIPDRVAAAKEWQVQERRRKAALIANDQAPAKASKRKAKRPTGPDPVKPTAEWIARYGESQATARTESGVFLGRPYRREPYFETLMRLDWADARRKNRAPLFTAEDLQALQRYRNAFEAAQRSETKSCLDVSNARGTDGSVRPEPSTATLAAKRNVAMMEARVGAVVDTLRAVALQDMSYAEVAMARFGYREVDFYDDATGMFVLRPRPLSWRHSDRVRDEFVQAVKALGGRGEVVRLVVPDVPRSATPVTDALNLALERATKRVCGICVSSSVAADLARESASAAISEFNGLPITIREDWSFGWVLVEE